MQLLFYSLTEIFEIRMITQYCHIYIDCKNLLNLILKHQIKVENRKCSHNTLYRLARIGCRSVSITMISKGE